MAIAWTPGIGDPTALDWLIVFAYLVATISTGIAARRACLGRGGDQTSTHARRDGFFWLFLALALAFLGVNKQLDLQSLLTETARQNARTAGWYEQRRAVQLVFVSAIAAAGLVASFGLTVYLRHAASAVKVAAVGATVLGAFVVVRAASFHHVNLPGLRAGAGFAHVIELGAVLLIAIAAMRFSADVT